MATLLVRHAQREHITACGSGHFLLGAFEQLNQAWLEAAPGLDAKERVRHAMASIHGVDINPFAVAIARFRLTVAALKATGEHSLVGVPPMGFRLAIGDSLLGEFGGAPQELQFEGEDAETYLYDTEDLREYAGILRPSQYHVVVGNPPYITVKDKALNSLYRRSYPTAARKYALSAPFMELMFRLAIRGEQGQGAGYVGQITSNSFMKREFGKKLIEWFIGGHDLGNPVDLIAVVDTSGAYIPGHGTPTVIIVGRRRRPTSDQVRAVLGVRGEPGEPANPSKGLVWTEIVEHFSDAEYDGSFVTVTDLGRDVLTSHPWSLTGGGAADLREAIEDVAARKLGVVMEEAGFSDITGNDDVFLMSARAATRKRMDEQCRPFVEGDVVRDYRFDPRSVAFLPMTASGSPIAPLLAATQYVWPFRKLLRSAIYFGKTPEQRGLRWYDHAIYQPGKHANGFLLTYAFVSTHNHFALERGGHLFNKSAPVIKLPGTAAEDDHLELLGVLNSSTACFWLKQVSYPKGGDPVGNEGARVSASGWDDRYEFTGTKLEQFPLPTNLPLDRGRLFDELARELTATTPSAVVRARLDSSSESLSDALAKAETEWHRLRGRMIFEQEELDWEVYRLYGLIDVDLTYTGSGIAGIDLGQRAFEIDLARRVERGEEETAWFERHGSTPLTDLPDAWPDDYKALVQRRLDLMDSDRSIRLLEKPEFKRRWATIAWEAQRTEALQSAILDRLEDPMLWQDPQGPITRSLAELADLLRTDPVLKELASTLTGTAEPDLGAVLGGLIPDEAVPYLAAYRYKPAGIEKYRAWQGVWALQRREDAGEKVTVAVPPKYGQGDFAKATYWRARGKLDVPKERFIAYPGVGREGDPTPVLGWAGWSHRDQALALAREIPVQQALGADDEVLVPLVAGLVELEPWLAQWYSEIEPQFGASPASVIAGVIDQYLARMEKTRDQVMAWTPPASTRGRRVSQ